MKKLIFTALALSGFATAQTQAIQFKTCKAATEAKLYLSKDNWLMIDAELWKDFPSLERNIVNISLISKALKQQGIILVPILIPQKPMVEGDITSSSIEAMKNYNRSEAVKNYKNILTSMRSLGIVTPDIVDALKNQPRDMFFRGDHHITPQGAANIAKATASLVKNLSSYKTIPEIKYVTVEKGTLPHPDPSRTGALVGLCGPQPQELISLRTTTRQKEASLLDDETPQIVYVGTSNGRGTWNLNGEFQQALSKDVLDAHLDAGGAYTPLMNYLLSDNYKSEKPKIILWEWNIEESYYNREGSYVFDSPQTYQTVIPAIYGKCTSSSLLTKSSTSKKVTIDLSKVKITEGDYLSISYSDKSLSKVKATFSVLGGSKSESTIIIPDRLTERNQTFIGLPKGKVSSVVLDFDSKSANTSQIDVCKPPNPTK